MAVKLWRFSDPDDDHFARAGRRGTWREGEECASCNVAKNQRVRPLVVEWQPGSEVVGDFVWPGFDSDMAVTERVRRVLSGSTQCEFGEVRMVQDSALRRGIRSKPRVWLPYNGPELFDVWVTTWVHADLSHSSLELEEECPSCDRIAYRLHGAERKKVEYDSSIGDNVRTRVPRVAGQGVFVKTALVQDAGLFRVEELPAWIFCTDGVKRVLVDTGFTNLDLLEVGETL